MDDLGKGLRAANKSFDSARQKLSEGRGNLVSRAEHLRDLGAKPKFTKKAKPIPPHWLSSGEAEDDEDELELAAEASELVVAENVEDDDF
jgi:DNA recombination protein RmuC